MKLIRKNFSKKVYGVESRQKYEEDRILDNLRSEKKSYVKFLDNYRSDFNNDFKKKGDKLVDYKATDLTPEKFSNLTKSDWKTKSSLVEGDEKIARDNIETYAKFGGERAGKQYKKGLTVLGSSGGLVLGAALTKGKSAKPALAGLVGGGFLGNVVGEKTKNSSVKRGYKDGEYYAVFNGHGDRFRGSTATTNTLKAGAMSNKLPKPPKGFDNFTFATRVDEEGNNKYRRLAMLNSKTGEVRVLKDKGEKL